MGSTSGFPGTFDHLVQLHGDETFLYGVIGEFFVTGLDVGEPAVGILTEAHRTGLRAHLESKGVDVDEVSRLGKLLLLDARDTLNQFMVAGMPDRERFEAAMAPLFGRLTSAGRTGQIRAYGEMVNLLWREGNAAAGLELERLWNECGRRHAFKLLCGSDLAGFAPETRSGKTEVADEPDRPLREVARLQQRARALESEIEQRKALEQELLAALADRTRLEEELRRQNHELSRTVRFSEMFVGILGHDLRNPLSAITTTASLLKRRAESDTITRPADRILKSAARMGRMIDQLLDFTRIRLGEGLPIENARTDLCEICRLAIEEFESTGEAARVVMECAGDPVGLWDVDRLQQLISNLVSNALTHGRQGELVRIRLDGSDSREMVLSVTNDGAVPPHILPVMFEPFRSGINQKQERSNGLGLGLFIGQQIVLAHSGLIDVASSESEGTCFTVRLPRSSSRRAPVFMMAGTEGV